MTRMRLEADSYPEGKIRAQASQLLDFGLVKPRAEKPIKHTQISDLKNCEIINCGCLK